MQPSPRTQPVVYNIKEVTYTKKQAQTDDQQFSFVNHSLRIQKESQRTTNPTHGSHIQRREEIASVAGATTWQKKWAVWEAKDARNNYFSFFWRHKGRTQGLFPSCVLLSHKSGTWLAFQADCPAVLMEGNKSKISICVTNPEPCW